MNLPLDAGLGFVIGLSLSLLGGGGSILTVPALVYLAGQSPQAAVSSSLAIVGVNSAFGAIFHRNGHTLNGRVLAFFGGAGTATAYLSAGLSSLFSPPLLMVLFSALMLFVGWLMARPVKTIESSFEKNPSIIAIVLAGAGVGLLTGLLGVGGGFLIMPALVLLVGLPIQQAIGTSLIIIAANSLVGYLGHLQNGAIDIWLTLIFCAAGIMGSFVGARFAYRLRAELIRRLFAIFVILLAIALLADNLPKLFYY